MRPMQRVINSKFLLKHIGEPCPYCFKKMEDAGPHTPSRDHVLPKSQGHGFANDNRVICCDRCNASKSNLHLVTWWWKLMQGGDRRAPIIFAFIMERHKQGKLNLKQGIKKKAFECFQHELGKKHRSSIALEGLTAHIVTRIGADEIKYSLMATWQ